jgi:L-alanine-DL-glutamate epimerase-like enolase superfamily enzyme
MAREARHYVEEQGYRIIKVKVGLDPQGDIEALRQIREAVGDQVRLRADANQGYTVTGALKALEGFAALGVDVVEQCLPDWDLEGAAFLRSKVRGIDLMLDESIHNPHDAARACGLGAADMFNIKLMKCGGLYPGARIAATAASFGLRCMVGCMLETRLALTAGLSLVAARGNITDADCDSFLSFDEKQAGVTGGFTIEDGVCRLSEEGGLGVTVDF